MSNIESGGMEKPQIKPEKKFSQSARQAEQEALKSKESETPPQSHLKKAVSAITDFSAEKATKEPASESAQAE